MLHIKSVLPNLLATSHDSSSGKLHPRQEYFQHQIWNEYSSNLISLSNPYYSLHGRNCNRVFRQIRTNMSECLTPNMKCIDLTFPFSFMLISFLQSSQWFIGKVESANKIQIEIVILPSLLYLCQMDLVSTSYLPPFLLIYLININFHRETSMLYPQPNMEAW